MDRAGMDRSPRVLIEALEWAVGEATAAAFRSAGWEAVTCTGPVGLDERCPYLDGRGCSKVEWADVVVSRLGLQDVRNRELVERLAQRSERPMVVETPAPMFARLQGALGDCVLVPYPARLDDLVAAAERGVAASPVRQLPGGDPRS